MLAAAGRVYHWYVNDAPTQSQPCTHPIGTSRILRAMRAYKAAAASVGVGSDGGW